MSVSDDNLVEFVKFSWPASELSESGEEVEEEMEMMASRATPSTCRWAALILIDHCGVTQVTLQSLLIKVIF